MHAEQNRSSLRQYVAEINNYPLKKPRRKNWAESEALVQHLTELLQQPARLSCEVIAQNPHCASYWYVSLVKSPQFNAFASNSNSVVVFSGLVEQIKYDDELALVLAHEMGHHAHNHIQETQNRGVLGAVVGGLLGAATGDPQTAAQMANIGASVASLSYSIAQENEADQFALMILSEAGFSASKARHLLLRMAKMGGNIESSFLDSHPSGPERLASFDDNWRSLDASMPK